MSERTAKVVRADSENCHLLPLFVTPRREPTATWNAECDPGGKKTVVNRVPYLPSNKGFKM